MAGLDEKKFKLSKIFHLMPGFFFLLSGGSLLLVAALVTAVLAFLVF